MLKKALVLLAAATLLSVIWCAALAEDDALYRIEINDKWGYMNSRGEVVIEPQWDTACAFRGGYAVVGASDYMGDGIIDTSGKYVVEPAYTMDEGYDGFYYGGKDTGVVWAMGDDGRMGFFDIPTGFFSGIKYGMCNPWNIGDRLVGVCDENDFYGYARRDTGELVIPYSFEYRCDEFIEGFAAVYLDEDYSEVALINEETGDWYALPDGFELYGTRFSEGRIAVRDIGTGKCGYADKTGAIVIPAIYEDAQAFGEGCAAVKLGGLWGHIGIDGNTVCEPRFTLDPSITYNAGYSFHNGLASLSAPGGVTTVINMKGEEQFSMQGVSLSVFGDNGLAVYSVGDDYESFGVVDTKGNIVLSADAGYRFDYSYAFGYEDYFAEGRQVLTKDGLFGFIDEKGAVTVDFIYDFALNYVNGLAYVKTTDGKLAYIDYDGNTVWQEP